jgi:hypothetical protein
MQPVMQAGPRCVGDGDDLSADVAAGCWVKRKPNPCNVVRRCDDEAVKKASN